MPIMRLFVTADVRAYREALALMLDREAHLDVVGTSACTAEAAARIAALGPDVVLVDSSCPEALALVAELADRAVESRVVTIAARELDDEVLACVEAGVTAFVPVDGSLGDVLATLANVERGESVVSPRIATTLIRRVRALGDSFVHDGVPLTAREREILRLIERGLSNKEIARRLSIEVSTVKNHVHHILGKLEVSRRTDAAAKVRAGRFGQPAAVTD
jgi:two-component system, NarL family, nitrate/nitrite response regulator NarL